MTPGPVALAVLVFAVVGVCITLATWGEYRVRREYHERYIAPVSGGNSEQKRIERIAVYEASAENERKFYNRSDLQGLPNMVDTLRESRANARYWQQKADALKRGHELPYRSVYQDLYERKAKK